MAKNEIDLTSSNKIKLVKVFGDVALHAIENNTKDFKELCEVAKKELESNNPSDEYYKVIQKGIDLYDKAIAKTNTVEEREKIRQEAKELIEKAEKNEEIRISNNKNIVEKVFEKNAENKQFDWTIVRNLGIAVITITGGGFLYVKGKDFVGKLIDKK